MAGSPIPGDEARAGHSAGQLAPEAGQIALREIEFACIAVTGIDGGGNGSIIGRNSFQRKKEDALKFLSSVMGIYEGSIK